MMTLVYRSPCGCWTKRGSKMGPSTRFRSWSTNVVTPFFSFRRGRNESLIRRRTFEKRSNRGSFATNVSNCFIPSCLASHNFLRDLSALEIANRPNGVDKWKTGEPCQAWPRSHSWWGGFCWRKVIAGSPMSNTESGPWPLDNLVRA